MGGDVSVDSLKWIVEGAGIVVMFVGGIWKIGTSLERHNNRLDEHERRIGNLEKYGDE